MYNNLSKARTLRQFCIIFFGVLTLYTAGVYAKRAPQADFGPHFWDVRDFGAVGDGRREKPKAVLFMLLAATISSPAI